MENKARGILNIALFCLVLAGCGTDEAQPTDHSQPTEANTEKETEKPASTDPKDATPTGNVVEATVSAANFEFDVKEINAKVGDTIKLTLVNSGGAHGLAIDAFDVDIHGDETIEFVVTEAGEFDYYCSLVCGVGHDKMIGKLIVT